MIVSVRIDLGDVSVFFFLSLFVLIWCKIAFVLLQCYPFIVILFLYSNIQNNIHDFPFKNYKKLQKMNVDHMAN